MKGELRIEQMLEDDTLFEPGRYTVLESPAGGVGRETEIEYFRRQHGRCIIKLRGIDSIAEAERYVGFALKIPGAALPVPKEGYFYTFQLKGCRVFTADGECVGTVTDVVETGGGEILQVDNDNREILIPFAQSYIKDIDPEAGKIEVDLPEDLRNLNT